MNPNMKKLKQLTHYGIVCAVMSLCAAGLPSCGDDYDDTEIKKEIQDVKDRVAKLEEWQKSVNSDITSIKGLVEALQQKNFITDVTPVTENGEEVGYTITFQTGKSITIKNGVNGKTPIIGVAKEGDIYYWTIKIGDADALFMTDADGNKMPVTGPKGEDGADAVAPKVRINTESNEWELSTDGGETWTGTGVKATGANGENGENGEKGDKGDRGDAIFAEDGIDAESDPDNVIFTLADGTTLTIPKAKELAVAFDSFDSFTVNLGENEIAIVLPSTLKESDFTALVAEVKSETGTGMDIYTKAGSSAWSVKITGPTFTDGKYNNDAKVKIKMPSDAKDGEKAILRITLITGNGQEISASRNLVCNTTLELNITSGGLVEAELDKLGIDPASITKLKLKGSLTPADFIYITDNCKSTLESIDLSETDITEIYNETFKDFRALEEAILPETLQKIGDLAFCRSSLKSIVIPNSVTEIGKQAFSAWATTSDKTSDEKEPNCKLESVVIGSGLKQITKYSFYHQENLKSVTFAEGSILENIGDYAFCDCKSLKQIKLPETLNHIWHSSFRRCGLTEITIPDNVTALETYCFSGCDEVTKITISKDSKLKSIGNFAFSFKYAPSSRTIELPASLEDIGQNIFNCHNGKAIADRIYYIDTIILHSPKVLYFTGGGGYTNHWPFGPTPYNSNLKIKLKVPKELVEAYKNTHWVNKNIDINYIEAIEE